MPKLFPVAPYQPFDMSNPRLDTPMMMTQDDMLAIEADRPSYPALMNGINNVTTSSMTPYVNTTSQNQNRAMVPASKALVSPNNHVMTPNNQTNNQYNQYPQLDYSQQHQQQSLPAPASHHLVR